VTRSLMPMTTFMSCSMSSTVRPSACAARATKSVSSPVSSGSSRPSAHRAAAAWARWPAHARSRVALVAVRQVAGERLAPSPRPTRSSSSGRALVASSSSRMIEAA
jgi:hypothetical protein